MKINFKHKYGTSELKDTDIKDMWGYSTGSTVYDCALESKRGKVYRITREQYGRIKKLLKEGQ